MCVCVQFMESVGNDMSNTKFEGCLGDLKRPNADASKLVYLCKF